MKNMKFKLIAVLLFAVVLFSGCSANNASKEPENVQDRTFTIEELKSFNGKDGNPAYVAVDGIVYDVTNIRTWGKGDHNGYEAGKDFTEEIKSKSPHGVKMLNGVPVVGKLVE